jgi:hypothetical protein
MGISVYFASPYSAGSARHERKPQGVVRQFLQIGTECRDVSHRAVTEIESSWNDYPRNDSEIARLSKYPQTSSPTCCVREQKLPLFSLQPRHSSRVRAIVTIFSQPFQENYSHLCIIAGAS